MTLFGRQPRWTSRRKNLEERLSDLQECSSFAVLKQTHAQVLKFNLHQDLFIAPKFICAYTGFDHLRLAVNVFTLIRKPNTLAYNTLIRAYALSAQPAAAFLTFSHMQKSGVFSDNFTYPFLLKACNGRFLFFQVRMIHTHIAKKGFVADVFVPNSLIDSYAKSGDGGIQYAEELFHDMVERDVVTWNSIIAGLVRDSRTTEARKVFDKMPERNIVSWNTMLDGHAKAGELGEARELFDKIPEKNVVSWCSLLCGYRMSGDMKMVRQFFNEMPIKNLVSWAIVISGYAKKGLSKDASCFLDQMIEAGLELDGPTAMSILAACAESGLLGLGKRIHELVNRTKLRLNIQLCNALIDMYAKCGKLDDAYNIFEGMAKRDIVSWNSIIHGLAMHGQGIRALGLFHGMMHEGISPDAVTFIGVFSACTHVGLVKEGRDFFASMERDYGVVPQIEHYGCIIDLLGRGGLLVEAFALIKSMPFKCSIVIWGTLLAACKMHNILELAEEFAERVMKLTPLDSGNYVMMSNIYASTGCWDGVAKSRLKMKETSNLKPSGSSWIEIDGVLREFSVGDRSHPQFDKFSCLLNILKLHLKQDRSDSLSSCYCFFSGS